MKHVRTVGECVVCGGEKALATADTCFACYQRKLRAEQAKAEGHTPATQLREHKRIAKAKNKIEEALLELGYSPVKAQEMIWELTCTCSALARFLGAEVNVDKQAEVNVNEAQPNEPGTQESDIDPFPVSVDNQAETNVNETVAPPSAVSPPPKRGQDSDQPSPGGSVGQLSVGGSGLVEFGFRHECFEISPALRGSPVARRVRRAERSGSDAARIGWCFATCG